MASRLTSFLLSKQSFLRKIVVMKFLGLIVVILGTQLLLHGEETSSDKSENLPPLARSFGENFPRLQPEELEARADKLPADIAFEIKSYIVIRKRLSELENLLLQAQSREDWNLFTKLDSEKRILQEQGDLLLQKIQEESKTLNRPTQIERKSRQVYLEKRIWILEQRIEDLKQESIY